MTGDCGDVVAALAGWVWWEARRLDPTITVTVPPRLNLEEIL